MKHIKDIKNTSELKETNDGIKKSGALLIFYSPHCGHCQRLEPELEKVDKMLKQHKINKPIRKVSPEFIDSVDTKDVEIRGVPTIMVVNKEGKNKKTFPIDKERNSANLLEFMKDTDVIEKAQKGGRKHKNRRTSKNNNNMNKKNKTSKKKRKSLKQKRKTLRSKRRSFNTTRRKLH